MNRAVVRRKAPLKKAVRIPYIYDERLAFLYRRDQGTCQICGKRVDWRLRGQILNLDKPSIDHRQAKSKGGAKFAASNQQLAHLGCNIRKGTKTMRQVRAIQNPQSKMLRTRARLSPIQPATPPAPSLAELLRGC